VSQPSLTERLGIAGTGAVGAGLARLAAARGEVVVWARSPESEERAREAIGHDVRITTHLGALASCSFVVEAVAEDIDVKSKLLGEIGALAREDVVLGSTTSSLPVERLAEGSGRPDRFVGLHVFNPVPRMELVELVFAPETSEEVRSRARDLCEALGKTAVEVPDIPGFVVNRLLFPYLFSAVALMSDEDMTAEDVDRCMTLGAGMPMGPLALLDFVGLDVSQAIGEMIGASVPAALVELVGAGSLGRKSGGGFYDYG
jgi:3-hydroxybutyryl-CoA dehydrogenase